MKLSIASIMAGLICYGCVWYKAAPYTPDVFTYGVSVDHKTGEVTHEPSFSWSLKP